MYDSYSPAYSNGPFDFVASMYLLIILSIASIIAYVLILFFMGFVFKKAGLPAWKAWVPFYNTWTMFELGDQKGWISLLPLLGFIPIVGIIPLGIALAYSGIAAYRIGLNFGKSGAFVLLYIFFSLLWFVWLAVDSTAVWKGQKRTPVQAVPAGPSSASAPVSEQPVVSDSDSSTSRST